MQDLVMVTLNSIDLDGLSPEKVKTEIYKAISKLEVKDCYPCANGGFDE